MRAVAQHSGVHVPTLLRITSNDIAHGFHLIFPSQLNNPKKTFKNPTPNKQTNICISNDKDMYTYGCNQRSDEISQMEIVKQEMPAKFNDVKCTNGGSNRQNRAYYELKLWKYQIYMKLNIILL